jgi:hypothetical protein
MVMPVTLPLASMVAVAEAPDPPPPEKVTVGAVVYPDEPLLTLTLATWLALTVLVAVAGGVRLVMFRLLLPGPGLPSASSVSPAKSVSAPPGLKTATGTEVASWVRAVVCC